MDIGKLHFIPAIQAPELLGKPVRQFLGTKLPADSLWVVPIDDKLADTASFCEHYGVAMDISANCVVLEARRAEKTWYVACMVLATNRADVNGKIRKEIDARKVSFAPMDAAVKLSGMEYGGITPVGLPNDWVILIDQQVMDHPKVVIGSGIRGSKLLITTEYLAKLPGSRVMALTKTE